jgi:hypothetical protein
MDLQIKASSKKAITDKRAKVMKEQETRITLTFPVTLDIEFKRSPFTIITLFF